MNLLLAELPDFAWLGAAAVILFLIVALGGSMFLREMRALRSNLAEELRTEIENAKQAQPVAVQQPLVVQAHTQFTTQEETAALQAKMEDEFKRERSSRKAIYEKVEAQGAAIARLQTETTHQTRQLGSLDSKMDQVLLRLPRQNS